MQPAPLSAYERTIHENIKRNNQFLLALNIEPLRTAPKQQTDKKRPREPRTSADLGPRRKSARNMGSKKPVYNVNKAFKQLLNSDDDYDEDDDSNEDSDASRSGCWVEYDENEPHDPAYDRHFSLSPSPSSSSSSSTSSSSSSFPFLSSSTSNLDVLEDDFGGEIVSADFSDFIDGLNHGEDEDGDFIDGLDHGEDEDGDGGRLVDDDDDGDDNEDGGRLVDDDDGGCGGGGTAELKQKLKDRGIPEDKYVRMEQGVQAASRRQPAA